MDQPVTHVLEEAPSSDRGVPPPAGRAAGLSGLTPRAAALLLLLAVVCAFWVVASEVVTSTCLVGESVPAIPAIGCLLFLAGVSQVLRRRGARWGLRPQEILVVYAGLAITAPMASYGGLQLFLQNVSAVRYYAPSHPGFSQFAASLPSWSGPRDREIYRRMHEGTTDTPRAAPAWARIPLVGPSLSGWVQDARRVPWAEWAVPLAVWSGFFALLFGTTLCLALAFYQRWVHHERLSFPMVEMAISLVEGGGSRRGILQSPWMWSGFAIASAFNLFNFWHAFDPNVPALGMSFPLEAMFVDKPWNAIKVLSIRWDPALVGLGCLVSRDLLFSTWAWVAVLKLEAVYAASQGIDVPGAPFVDEQAQGAYLALAALLLWGLVRTRGKGDRPGSRQAVPEALLVPRRVALGGAAAGGLGLCLFAQQMGMAFWLAAAFFLLVLANAIVYTRIQAETGAPMVWLFPFYQPKLLPMNVLGSRFVMDHGGFGNLAALGLLTFAAVGYQPETMSWQLSNFTLAERAGRLEGRGGPGAWGIRPASMLAVLVLALVAGLAASWYALLTMYYKYGANVCRHMRDFSGAWTQVSQWQGTGERPDLIRLGAAGLGAAVSAATLWLRGRFVGFPLHPLGFAVAATHGDVVWAPFFTAWVLKGAVLKVGGPRFYREVVPLFIGLAVGHFFMAGVVWSLVAMLNGSAPGGYIVYFG